MRGRRTAFTLSELMVAVVVLLVVILATGRLFNTASTVAGLGEANSDVLQDAAAIERQMRSDFQRISHEGFLLVRCVEVPNNVNGAPFLNPALPADAPIRCDQLYFFTQGPQQMVTFGTVGSNIKGMGTAARVYYGHAVQIPDGLPVEGNPSNFVNAYDPVVDLDDPLVPWYSGQYDMVRTVYRRNASGSPADYNTSNEGSAVATQPPAPRWVLARHAVVLADDGGTVADYLGQNRTAPTIDSWPVFQGRVDGAAQDLSDIRRIVQLDAGLNAPRPWFDTAALNGDQRTVIGLLTGRLGNNFPCYPRAEREAPSMNRVDQALTNHIIGTWCSSMTVEWTFAPRTGEVRDDNGILVQAPDGEFLTGVLYNADDLGVEPAYREQPWFGLQDVQRGVYHYAGEVDAGGNLTNDLRPWWRHAKTLDPDDGNSFNLIEQWWNDPFSTGRVYEATFGYNQTRPLGLDEDGDPVVSADYTPWPSALRITLRLHDSSGRLTEGREVQFIIPVPPRR